MATAVAEAVSRAGPRFRVGQKKIYLPSFVIVFREPPKSRASQPANFACFDVPLNFTKFDLRDYLYHAYNVEVLNVRSEVIQQRPRRENEDEQRGRWVQPAPKKMMTVELVRPFVFPRAPEDLEPWDQAMYDRIKTEETTAGDARDRMKLNIFPLRDERPIPTDRVLLANQAQELLTGQRKWENKVELDEKWNTWEALREKSLKARKEGRAARY